MSYHILFFTSGACFVNIYIIWYKKWKYLGNNCHLKMLISAKLETLSKLKSTKNTNYLVWVEHILMAVFYIYIFFLRIIPLRGVRFSMNDGYVFINIVLWGITIWNNRTYRNSWFLYFWLTINSRCRRVSKF